MAKFHKTPKTPKTRGDVRAGFFEDVEAILKSMPEYKSCKRCASLFAFDVTNVADQEHRIYLENMFNELGKLGRTERTERIKECLNDVVRSHGGKYEIPKSFAAVRDSLYPVIRSCNYGIHGASDGPGCVPEFDEKVKSMALRRPFVPFLDIFVGRNMDMTIEFVGPGHLEAWEVGEDLVFEAAYQCLAKIMPSTKLKRVVGGAFEASCSDHYIISRLLTPGFLASFKNKVMGRPVAIIPDRSTLMIAGDGRPDILETFTRFAQDVCAESPRPISPALYTCCPTTGAVIPYRRSGGKLGVTVDIGHGKLCRCEYEEQKRKLDRVLRPGDAFVAHVELYVVENKVVSFARWTKGVDTYLPEVSHIALMVKTPGVSEKKVVEVPFEVIASRLTEIPEFHPKRYRTGEFPTDEELASMEHHCPQMVRKSPV